MSSKEERDGIEVGEHHIDGPDPTAEVGPEEAEAGVEECEIGPAERDAPVHEAEYLAGAELEEAFPIEALATVLAADQLPDHSAEPFVGGTHPFTYETVCCVEDARQYVEIFEEEGAPAVLGGGAAYDHATTRSRYAEDGKERERQVFEPFEVEQRWGYPTVKLTTGKFLPVRPRRPACIYYARQHFAHDGTAPGEPGHNIIFRVCTHPARRSIGGAAMKLRDEAVYGCDLRHPRDAKSLEWLNEHDERKLRTRPHLELLPLFGLPGERVVIAEDEKVDMVAPAEGDGEP